MHVKTFYALLAAKHDREKQEVIDLYQTIRLNGELSQLLREGAKEDILAALRGNGIEVNEQSYRHLRTLSITQLTPEQAALAQTASQDDQGRDAEAMSTFLTNTIIA